MIRGKYPAWWRTSVDTWIDSFAANIVEHGNQIVRLGDVLVQVQADTITLSKDLLTAAKKIMGLEGMVSLLVNHRATTLVRMADLEKELATVREVNEGLAKDNAVLRKRVEKIEFFVWGRITAP